MKKYLTALVLAFVLWTPALAQEAEDDDENIETNAFGYPDKNLVKIIDAVEVKGHAPINPKSDCNDPRLAAAAREALRPFIHSDYQSIADKRKTKLVLKNTDNFMPLPLAELTPDENRRAAGRVLELKINSRLGEENIKVCQSDNPILSAKLYLVMYDDGDKVKVDIVNFSTRNIPSFIFDKN